jgi:hypothetical protein
VIRKRSVGPTCDACFESLDEHVELEAADAGAGCGGRGRTRISTAVLRRSGKRHDGAGGNVVNSSPERVARPG